MAVIVLTAIGVPAHAGCGLDPVCAISESAGRGAGKGAADSLRPLVTQVMEEEAPALIAQLQAAVDHNILTAEQAGQKLVDYATDLFNKAADDVVDKVANRSKSLIDYAAVRTIEIEKIVFADVQTIMKQLDCQGKSVAAALDRQRKITQEAVGGWFPRLFFWRRSKTEILEASCRTNLSVPDGLTYEYMERSTLAKLWRCVRIGSVDPNGPAIAIRDAFNDVEVNDRAAMCALEYDAEPLREVTGIWADDNQSAKAWGRAVRGD
ncbi:hypothetical protein CO662_22040 [Rhizobium anhuiense]|uniref:Uncharacterized protein n=1 Tax=Rhizobium anhuiense TaxID=1184720 RepID=A0ABX4J3I0_9HYPH|nr:hypothetical protein [Rhizobium anhuiense]PDS49755.1 hypothetical protein CO662_22040 [Rhizobium anhuiense]